MRILVIDALSHTRESLKTFLQLHDGIEVVGEAATGSEALHLSQILQPDIVIMDVNLPDIKGFDVTRKLTALAPAPAVILLTVHLTEQDQQAAHEAGAWTYVEKSAGVEPILAAIYALYPNHQEGETT